MYTILDTVHCQVLSNTLETGFFLIRKRITLSWVS